VLCTALLPFFKEVRLRRQVDEGAVVDAECVVPDDRGDQRGDDAMKVGLLTGVF
jgi:hypothetical protein